MDCHACHFADAATGGPAAHIIRREAIGDIGDRMLALRLRDLEQRGLVTRHVIEGPPSRVEYVLTEAGRGFRAVAEAAQRWGAVVLEARNAIDSSESDEK